MNMGNANSEIKNKVMTYIHEVVYVEKDKINDESLIFKEGFIDSMGFISLISFLENEFGVVADDNDLTEENFESINAISAFISTKLQ